MPRNQVNCFMLETASQWTRLTMLAFLVLTTMVTNAVSTLSTACRGALICGRIADLPQVLGGIADTVAQSITAVRSRARANQRLRDPGNDLISIEIRELDK